MSKISVISGNTSEGLADGIAARLNAGRVGSKIVVFPDGESKITLSGEITRDRAIVVQSISPPTDTNLVRALLLISKASEVAARVTAVIPYMGYARQDREFLPGEIVTMKVLGGLLSGAGAAEIIVVDIHSMAGLEHLTNADNVTAIPDLARHFKGMKLGDPLVVSPDRGGEKRAEEFASILGAECIVLEKERDRNTGEVKIKTANLSTVAGRDLILVDDMISTGGSIAKASEFLKGQGCGEIYAACTHALLVNDAEQRIMESGVSSIVSTNTIPGKTSVVDISGAIADSISQSRPAR